MLALKTDSYEDFYAACEDAGLTFDGEIVTATYDYQIDLIGTIYERTGNTITDDDGLEHDEKTACDGYHVNIKVRGDFVTGLEHLEIECETPQYKFAGD